MAVVHTFFIDVLYPAILVSEFAGCAAALLLGIWILIRPDALARLNAATARWFSTRRALKPLMMAHRSEPFVYRHHRIMGVLVTVGAAFTLYAVLYRFNEPATVAALGPGNRYLLEWAVESVTILLALGAVFAVVIGVYLVIRPSLLKRFEAWSNQRISTRTKLRFLETMHEEPDRLAERYPRVVAALIVIGSLYAIVQLGLLLLVRV